MLHTLWKVVEGRVPIDLVARRLEERILLVRTGRRDRPGWDDPDRDALLPPGVDVPGHPQRHRCIGSMQAADVVMGQTTLASDEDLPERPLPAVCHAATPARDSCFAAYATAASRTQRPFSCARTRCSIR